MIVSLTSHLFFFCVLSIQLSSSKWIKSYIKRDFFTHELSFQLCNNFLIAENLIFCCRFHHQCDEVINNQTAAKREQSFYFNYHNFCHFQFFYFILFNLFLMCENICGIYENKKSPINSQTHMADNIDIRF